MNNRDATKKRGRPLLGDVAISTTERSRSYRARRKQHDENLKMVVRDYVDLLKTHPASKITASDLSRRYLTLIELLGDDPRFADIITDPDETN